MGDASEQTPLVARSGTKGLSWIFATFCIVDLFGVLPVVALPRPIIDCGWLGIPLAIFVLIVQIYTADMLGRCWLIAEVVDPSIKTKTRYPYAAIAELCFGVHVRRLVSFFLHVTIFGGGIPSLLIASQLLNLVGLRVTGGQFDLSFCYWLIVLGVFLCPILWLGSPKDMKFLAITSCLIVLTVVVLTWTSMIQDDSVIEIPPQPEPSWEAVAIAYAIISFQFDVHPMVLTIQVDMDKKQKLGQAVMGSFAVSGGFFLVTTALARNKYGATVSRNLLQTLPGDGLLYANIVLVTIQTCLSMVVGGSALFQDLEEKLNIPPDFNWKRCAVRCIFIFSSVLIGEFVPRFDLIMGVIGGTLTSPLMFVFPTLFYLKLRSMQQRIQLHNVLEYCYEKTPPYNPYFDLKATPNCPTAEQMYFHKNCVHDTYRNSAYGMEDTEELCFEPVLPSVSKVEYYGEDFMRARKLTSATNTIEPKRANAFTWCEIISSVLIILLGILATCTATYYSLKSTVNYAKKSSPCFM